MSKRPSVGAGQSSKKRDPVIIAAIITLVGSVLAALLASPVLISLIQRTPEPTISSATPTIATSTASLQNQPAPTASFKACAFPIETMFRPMWEAHKDILGCPVGIAVQLKKAADQAFQGGRMFWRADIDNTYVIYDRQLDGTELYYGYWTLHPVDVRWDGSYPNGVGLKSPKDMYEPVRGFGWLWRTFYGGPDGALGWALNEEHGWENFIMIQDFEWGVLLQESDLRIYALADNGKFYSQR